MKKSQFVKQVAGILGLTAPIRIKTLKSGYIRRTIDGETVRAVGYYDLAYSEKLGQYHSITISPKAENPRAILAHELIHAWQAENGFWKYGHAKGFKAWCIVLALELNLDYEDIFAI